MGGSRARVKKTRKGQAARRRNGSPFAVSTPGREGYDPAQLAAGAEVEKRAEELEQFLLEQRGEKKD